MRDRNQVPTKDEIIETLNRSVEVLHGRVVGLQRLAGTLMDHIESGEQGRSDFYGTLITALDRKRYGVVREAMQTMKTHAFETKMGRADLPDPIPPLEQFLLKA